MMLHNELTLTQQKDQKIEKDQGYTITYYYFPEANRLLNLGGILAAGHVSVEIRADKMSRSKVSPFPISEAASCQQKPASTNHNGA